MIFQMIVQRVENALPEYIVDDMVNSKIHLNIEIISLRCGKWRTRCYAFIIAQNGDFQQ